MPLVYWVPTAQEKAVESGTKSLPTPLRIPRWREQEPVGSFRRHRSNVLDLGETQITSYVVASPTEYGVFCSQTGVAR